jgi:hypothetical protein
MNRIQSILSFLITLTFGQCLAQSGTSDRNEKIKIPTEWIENLHHFNYTQSNTSLLKDFESFIFPDTLTGSKGYSHDHGGLLNPMFIDLDHDQSEELIGLFGWSENDPMMAVFKLVDTTWYLIYTEPFDMFYTSPELQVVNNFSENKVFYIRWLYERGSGIYADTYHFYKLINNHVYHCLEIINKAHISGWGLKLNQSIETKFAFNCATRDEVWVTYNYSFFPGPVFDQDMSWKGHPEISFVKDENGINYVWDSLSYSYKPEFYDRTASLSEEKILCMGIFGNDSLFVKAFDYEIKQTLENGTKEQKKQLTSYLNRVKADQMAAPATDALKEK